MLCCTVGLQFGLQPSHQAMSVYTPKADKLDKRLLRPLLTHFRTKPDCGIYGTIPLLGLLVPKALIRCIIKETGGTALLTNERT